MVIRRLQKNEMLPLDLLLEADPSEALIQEYAANGFCYVAEQQGKIIGTYILLPLNKATIEIKNIAVAASQRGKGYGKQLIEHAVSEAAHMEYQTVEIGTGNSSLDQLALYQKCDFRMLSIDRGFFIRNYPEPIIENGIQCRDMIRLDINL